MYKNIIEPDKEKLGGGADLKQMISLGATKKRLPC